MPQIVCHERRSCEVQKFQNVHIYLFAFRISFNFTFTRMWKYLHLMTLKPICCIYLLHSFIRSTYISRLVHTRTWSLYRNPHKLAADSAWETWDRLLFSNRCIEGGFPRNVLIKWGLFSDEENKSHELQGS